MGAVLDVYWHFSEPGDHFLGRVLTGLDPNKSEFATAPPHFMMEGNLMEDKDIHAAMYMMYGPILEKYKGNAEINPTGLLLMVLASVIYHSSWISEIIIKKPGHPFSLMPLMNNPQLLERLRGKVGLKVGGQVSRITGIPPHIQNAILCTKLLKLCSETLVEVKELTTNIKAAVSAVYEEKAEENGHLTGERLKIMFDDYQDRVLKTIDDRMKDISMRPVVEDERETVVDNFADGDIDETEDINSDVNLAERQQHRLYTHCGKMWHVPKNFSFPTNAKLLTGWQLWVGGQPGYKMKKVGMNEGSDEYQLAPVC